MEKTNTSRCRQTFNSIVEGFWGCLDVICVDSGRSRVPGVVQNEASTLIIDREGVDHESSCCHGWLTEERAKFLKNLYAVIFLCVLVLSLSFMVIAILHLPPANITVLDS